MLFDYNSGLAETYNRTGAYLPGDIVKTSLRKVESLNSNKDLEFGTVITRDVSGVTPKVGDFVETSTSADIYGVAVRDVTSEHYLNGNARVINKYFKGEPVSVMRDGYVAVPVQNGVAKKGGQVYIRVKPSLDNPALPIGGVEATNGLGVIAWKNVKFVSDGVFPFVGKHESTTSTHTTSQIASILVWESEYGIFPTVESAPTAASAEYGTALEDITLSGGSVKAGTTTVAGTWSFVNPELELEVGTHTVAAIFTPNNTKKYEIIYGVEVVVTITE